MGDQTTRAGLDASTENQMATDLEKQFAALKSKWDEQDAAWKVAQAACARLGDAHLLVPNEFLQRLDALALAARPLPFLRPDGAVRA
jgi:hypothetical protein